MNAIRGFVGRFALITQGEKKLRICIAAPSLAYYGGQAIQAQRLIQAFAAEDAVSVEFLPHNPQLPSPLSYLQKIKYLRTVATSVYYALLLLIRMRRYDIVHVFSASYWSYLLSIVPPLVIAKLFGKKIILHYHSGEAEDHLTRWPLTTVPLMRRFDAIVVPSGYLLAIFARFGVRAQVIPNVLDLVRFKFRDRVPLRPIFLSCRLLEPLYNVANVIRAFHLIQRRVPDASLTIAAAGTQRPMLEKLVGDLKLERVSFVGIVPFDSMPELYDAHDIQLIGNDIDNMPAAITESCACGILIVTTSAGGIPFIVTHEHSALMVDCGDYAGLAREAERLLKHPELARNLAQNAREVAKDFSWERVGPRWLSLYRHIGGRRT